jgi:hypothetical protein
MSTVLDPELDVIGELIDGANYACGTEMRRGAEVGMVWADLWANRSELTRKQVPMHGSALWLCLALAEEIGWFFRWEVLTEEWAHHGEKGWVLAVFENFEKP